MFWRFSYSSTQITTLLEKEDVTLKEILDEDDVLQECKSNNEKLVEFLAKPEHMKVLVENVVTLPSEELDESTRFKYSSISCELLTCDNAQMNDALVNSEELMEKLYSFLSSSPDLNPLLASYFSKVFGCLITRRTDALLSFLEKKSDFLALILQHINTSSIMDIILRLITTVDSIDSRNKVLEWLKRIKLVDGLIELFSSTHTNEIHANASQLLSDIIRIAREQILSSIFEYENMLQDETFQNMYKSSLLSEIEKSEVVNKIIDLMFETIDKAHCSVPYAIEVLLTLIEPKTTILAKVVDIFDMDTAKRDKERQEIATYVSKIVVECCSSRLETFQTLLINSKPKKEEMNMSNGQKIPLLGIFRLNIIKLIAKLIYLNNEQFNSEITKCNLINVILDMVFNYKWNNFLHSHLLSIFQTAFPSANSASEEKNDSEELANELEDEESKQSQKQTSQKKSQQPIGSKQLIEHFFRDCQIIKRLVNAWYAYFESSDKEEKTKKCTKPVGYIGQLTAISNLIQNNHLEGRYAQLIQSCFDTYVDKELSEQWKELLETKIADINKINSKDLVKNPLSTSLNDSKIEIDFVDMPSDERLNKKFMDMQKDMKINCVEDFSLSESEIVNTNTKFSFSKTKTISFNLESNDDSAQAFEELCSQRETLTLAAEKSNFNLEEDVWISQEIKYSDDYNKNMFSSVKSEHDDDQDLFKNITSTSFKSLTETNTEVESNKKHYHAATSSSFNHYSSSSSSSSSDNDDEDNENTDYRSPTKPSLSKKNKRHYHQHHQPKESKSDTIKEDENNVFTNITVTPLSGSQQESNENWANFDEAMATETSDLVTIEPANPLLASTDPWSNSNDSNSSTDATSTPSSTNILEQQEWAKFE